MTEKQIQMLVENSIKLKESNTTADLVYYDQLVGILNKKVAAGSFLNDIAGVFPVTQPVGKIPVVNSYYIGQRGAGPAQEITSTNIRLFRITDTSLYTVGGPIILQQTDANTILAEGTVLFVEDELVLVNVTSGTFDTTNIVVAQSSVGDWTANTTYAANTVIWDTVVSAYYITPGGGTTGATSTGIGDDTGITDWVVYTTTIVSIYSNRAGMRNILKDYSGSYSTEVASLLSTTDNEIIYKVETADMAIDTRRIRSGFSREFMQDLMAYYNEDAYDMVGEQLGIEILDAIEMEAIDKMMTWATNDSDIVLTDSYGTQTSLPAVYRDLLSRVNKNAADIRANVNGGTKTFVIGSPNVIGALASATTFKPVNSNSPKVVGKIGVNTLVVEDRHAMSDYMIVGYMGGDGLLGNRGLIYTPHSNYIAFNESNESLEWEMSAMSRYDLILNPHDTGTGSSDSMYFTYSGVDFTGLQNF